MMLGSVDSTRFGTGVRMAAHGERDREPDRDRDRDREPENAASLPLSVIAASEWRILPKTSGRPGLREGDKCTRPPAEVEREAVGESCCGSRRR